MVIVFLPALDGIRPQWREAAVNLGASTWQYWRRSAGPLLLPGFLGAALLLFANAFAAYATAAVLVSQGSPILPLFIRAALTSEVMLGRQNLAFALAFEMVVVVAIVMGVYACCSVVRRGGCDEAVAAPSGGPPRRRLVLVRDLLPRAAVLAMLDFSTRDVGRRAAAPVQPGRATCSGPTSSPSIVTSLLLAVLTAVLMLVLLVPTMIWVRLRVPQAGAGGVPLPAAADDPAAGDRGRHLQRLRVGDLHLRRLRALTLTFAYVDPGAALRLPVASTRRWPRST